MSTQRSYSKAFKLSMVRLVLEEGKPALEVCREQQVPKSVLYRWLQDFSVRGEAAFQGAGYYHQKHSSPASPGLPRPGGGSSEVLLPSELNIQEPEARIVELERVCGQLAVENARLKRALAMGQGPVS